MGGPTAETVATAVAPETLVVLQPVAVAGVEEAVPEDPVGACSLPIVELPQTLTPRTSQQTVVLGEQQGRDRFLALLTMTVVTAAQAQQAKTALP